MRVFFLKVPLGSPKLPCGMEWVDDVYKLFLLRKNDCEDILELCWLGYGAMGGGM